MALEHSVSPRSAPGGLVAGAPAAPRRRRSSDVGVVRIRHEPRRPWTCTTTCSSGCRGCRRRSSSKPARLRASDVLGDGGRPPRTRERLRAPAPAAGGPVCRRPTPTAVGAESASGGRAGPGVQRPPSAAVARRPGRRGGLAQEHVGLGLSRRHAVASRCCRWTRRPSSWRSSTPPLRRGRPPIAAAVAPAPGICWCHAQVVGRPACWHCSYDPAHRSPRAAARRA